MRQDLDALGFLILSRLCDWRVVRGAYPQAGLVDIFGSDLLVRVDPRAIVQYVPRTKRYRSVRKFRFLVGGNWDDNLPEFSNHYTFEIVSDLLEGCDYDDLTSTSAFRRVENLIAANKFVMHRELALDSKESIIAYLRNCLRLKDSMVEHGYLSASDSKDKEIGLAVCRNGRLVHMSHGKHRLAFAQLLGLQRIVARVRVVHPQWYIGCAREFGGSVRGNVVAGLAKVSEPLVFD